MVLIRFGLLIFLPFLAVAGQGDPSAQFLSYEQFQQLSELQQIDYIQDIQKVVLQLEASPAIRSDAGLGSKPLFYQRLFSEVIASADANTASELDRVCTLTSAKHFSNEQLRDKITQTRNCTLTGKSRRDQRFVPSVPQRVQVLKKEFEERQATGRITPAMTGYDVAVGDLKLLTNQLNERGIGNVPSVKPVVVKPKVKAIVAEKKSSQPAKKAEVLQASGFQCLYAGFLIPKNPQGHCRPYKILPDDFSSEILSQEKFVCATSQQILCNPLLFGFEKPRKPLCVWRSQDATKNCFELAQRRNTLPQVLELWNSKNGKELYQKYVLGLQSLCDQESLKARNLRPSVYADIEKTCAVSFKVLEENIKNKFLPSLEKISRKAGKVPAKTSR